MKKAIVTGGGGFIGSHMVDLLLKKNFKVVVIDNFTGGHINNLSQHKTNRKLKIIKKDINNLSSYIKNFLIPSMFFILQVLEILSPLSIDH